MRKSTQQRQQIEYIHHCLNNSNAKTVYSFQKSSRFTTQIQKPPYTYYDVPSQFQTKLVSPGNKFRDTFETERTGGWRKSLSRSAEGRNSSKERARVSTFGIGRQDYYRSRTNSIELGPGAYDVPGSLERKPFYMGRKIQKKQHDDQPNCATYLISRQSLEKLSTRRRNGVPKIKTQGYTKGKYDKFDNKVPGPGSYTKRGMGDQANKTYQDHFKRKKGYSSFGIGDKVKTERSTYLGPGSYNRFSEFGTSRY